MRETYIWKTCEKCGKRNCRTTPSSKGICTKRVPVKEGFPLKELRNERSD